MNNEQANRIEKGVTWLHPPATGRLIGRSDEIAHLDEALDADDIALVGIIAPGGTGKSALIYEWIKALPKSKWLSLDVYAWVFSDAEKNQINASSNDFFVKISDTIYPNQSAQINEIEKAKWLFEQQFPGHLYP